MSLQRRDRRVVAANWALVLSSGVVALIAVVSALLLDDSSWPWFVAAVATGVCAAGVVRLRRASSQP